MARADTTAPVVRVDVLETFVELLTRSEADGSSDAFYSSLCEAVCRSTSMDRAIIFRYDGAHRRVRAAGAYGIGLEPFADSHVTVESAPIARQALVEDRVIEMDADAVAREVPERFRDLLGDSTLVCCPLSAGGRWSGVILTDRRPRRPLGPAARSTRTTVLDEVARLAAAHPELGIELAEGSAEVGVPRELEPLAQSVLIEAVRNARKHADPSRVEIRLDRQEGTWVMEVGNDGVHGRARTVSGMGLRLAALEALQMGGLVEFGEREPGAWRVRLAVPHERP